MTHSEECRCRIYKLMEDDDSRGKERLEKKRRKMDGGLEREDPPDVPVREAPPGEENPEEEIDAAKAGGLPEGEREAPPPRGEKTEDEPEREAPPARRRRKDEAEQVREAPPARGKRLMWMKTSS